MSERTLIWKDVKIDDEGRLTVPIVPPPDDEWLISFNMTMKSMGSETRGQVFSSPGVEHGDLCMYGTDPGAMKATADFFDAVVDRANRDMARSRSEHAIRDDARAEQQDARKAEFDAALDELRKRE